MTRRIFGSVLFWRVANFQKEEKRVLGVGLFFHLRRKIECGSEGLFSAMSVLEAKVISELTSAVA